VLELPPTAALEPADCSHRDRDGSVKKRNAVRSVMQRRIRMTCEQKDQKLKGAPILACLRLARKEVTSEPTDSQ